MNEKAIMWVEGIVGVVVVLLLLGRVLIIKLERIEEGFLEDESRENE